LWSAGAVATLPLWMGLVFKDRFLSRNDESIGNNPL
jgi:hypothetical protein